jgi:hypothetical protein
MLSTTELYFGDCEIGKMTNAKAVSLTNDGKTAIIVDNVSIHGDFIKSHSCPEPLEPGKSCIISIRFSPTETDKRSGWFVVNYKAPNDNSLTPSKQVELIGRGSVSLLYSLLPTLCIVILYFIALLFARWNMVARPTCARLRAYLNRTKAEVDILCEVAKKNLPGNDTIDTIRNEIDNLLNKFEEGLKDSSTILSRFLDILFWSRGRELAGWTYLHAVKEQSTTFLPKESVRAALECAETDLRQVATSTAIGLADRIGETLKVDAPEQFDRKKALLTEARSFLYESEDSNFTVMCVWHRKTMWLTFCSLMLIVCLATFLQNGVLFLVGAAGGLISRLLRSLYSKNVPTDYGASWTTLFLSPLVGALAGWSGILLLTLLVKLNIIGSALSVDWYDPYAPVTLSLALLFGISERLLSDFVTSLEEKLKPQAGTTKTNETASPKIDTLQIPDGKINETYMATLTASGGTKPYKWEPIRGTIPDGFTLDASGKIAGTPKNAGSFTFKLQVTDKNSKTASNEYTINVKNE